MGGLLVCLMGSSCVLIAGKNLLERFGLMKLYRGRYSDILCDPMNIFRGACGIVMRGHSRILTVFIFALMAVSASQLASLATGSANSSSRPVAVSQATTGAPTGAYFDHVVIILMENEGVYDICLSSPPPCSTSGPAPYMASLANTYGIGSQYLSIINTSQPNYVALIGGSTLGCTSSGCPTITAANLVDRFEAAGLSWKGYFENQNVAAGCDTSSHEPYEPIHNPFIPFQDITSNAARCNQLVLANPSTCGSVTDCVLINDLNSGSVPNFMWLTPNDCNDMRGASRICSASISLGDNYLKGLVPSILNSNTFKTGRSALFITFDEGNGYCPLNGSSESCVYSVWAGPAAKTGFGTSHLYNHYSFPKTVEVNWNLASLSTGDGSATPMTEFFNPTSPPPDYTVSASPTSLSINAGSASTSTITLTSINNFAGTVTVSATGSPAGLGVSLNPSSVSLPSGGTGTTTLTISTQSSTPAGSYTVTVTGSSGTLSHSTSIQVSVVQSSQQDFSIVANPASITLQRGTSASSTVTVTSLNGFSGTVALTDSISPATSNPPVLSLSSSSLTLSSGGSAGSTLTVTTSSSTTSGSYTILVTGTSGSLSHAVSLALTVSQTADFTLASNGQTVNILAGSSGTSTLTATSLGGFSGTVSLSLSAGTGLTASVSPTSLVLNSGGTAASTLTVSSGAIGNYTVTVTGTSGSLSHSVSVLVIVSDFSVSINPSSLSLPRGTSGTSLITLTSLNGFAGTVTLSTVVSPTSGPRTSLSSSTVSLTSGGQSTSTLNVRAQHRTPTGAYSVTVTVTSGSLSHSVSLTVNVTA